MDVTFDLTCLVGTFGTDEWVQLAHERAIPSAEAQGLPVIHRHAETLAKARNQALQEVQTEWCFVLDADDSLWPRYATAMSQGTADVRCPSVYQVWENGRTWGPIIPKVYNHFHECTAECLRVGNWLIVGAVVRTELAQRVAWEEWLWSEDWAYWARIWKNGATFEPIYDSVYQAHMRSDSRNRAISRFTQSCQHRLIEQAVWGSNVDPSTHPAYGKTL